MYDSYNPHFSNQTRIKIVNWPSFFLYQLHILLFQQPFSLSELITWQGDQQLHPEVSLLGLLFTRCCYLVIDLFLSSEGNFTRLISQLHQGCGNNFSTLSSTLKWDLNICRTICGRGSNICFPFQIICLLSPWIHMCRVCEKMQWSRAGVNEDL